MRRTRTMTVLAVAAAMVVSPAVANAGANEVTPVAPVFGLPDWPVTPGTGTRSKLNSAEPK